MDQRGAFNNFKRFDIWTVHMTGEEKDRRALLPKPHDPGSRAGAVLEGGENLTRKDQKLSRIRKLGDGRQTTGGSITVAVKANLVSRGLINLNDALCSYCIAEIETCEHLFISCSFVWKIWSHWIALWGLDWAMPRDFKSLFMAWNDALTMKSCDKVWKLALFAIIWTVWMTRNDLVFNNRQADLEQTIDLSKLRLAHWVKAKWPQII
ncbi:hypothetical protein DITRI_Ditri01bG0023600 [Diplodiscus trichospermus]